MSRRDPSQEYLDDWQTRSYAGDPALGGFYALVERLPEADRPDGYQDLPLYEIFDLLTDKIGHGKLIAAHAVEKGLIQEDEKARLEDRLNHNLYDNQAPRKSDLLLALNCLKDMPLLPEMVADWQSRSYAAHPALGGLYEILKRVPKYPSFTEPENFTLSKVLFELNTAIGGVQAVGSYIQRKIGRRLSAEENTCLERIKERYGRNSPPLLNDLTWLMGWWQEMPTIPIGKRVAISKHHGQETIDLSQPYIPLNEVIMGRFPEEILRGSKFDMSCSAKQALHVLFDKNGLLGNPKFLLRWSYDNKTFKDNVEAATKFANRLSTVKNTNGSALTAQEIDILTHLVKVADLDEINAVRKAVAANGRDRIIASANSRHGAQTNVEPSQ